MRQVPLALALAVAFVFSTQAAHASSSWDELRFAQSGWAGPVQAASPAPDGLLVDLRDDLDEQDVQALIEATHIQLDKSAEGVDGNRYEVHGDWDVLAKFAQQLSTRDEVESVEWNVYYSLFDQRVESGAARSATDGTEEPKPTLPVRPNDPMYKHQWHFAMVNAEGAWQRATGDGVVVAVIDTGVSPGKLPSGKKSRYRRVPDLDQTELVPGYNFVNNNDDPSDGNGHGTHVAGTIAQSTHNGLGVAGLAYKAKIMPIKVLSDRGFGSVGDIANGIRFAADHGAKVINMSLGGGSYSPTLARAVQYARNKGVVVACAAGNGGREKVEYPAAYPGAFAVSALGPDGALAFYSSYGKETDIAAPGGDTRVDLNQDGIPDGVLQDTIARGDPSRHGYFPFQGTSMATPHVAAAAALVASLGITDPDKIESLLQESATELGDPVRYGAGALNVDAAVAQAHREKSWLGLGLAASFAILVLRRNRRRDGLSMKPTAPSFWLALACGASGFFFLRDFGVAHTGPLAFIASPVAEWPALALGMSWHLSPVVGSAMLAFTPIAFLLGVKRLQGALGGFALGVAGFLLSMAFLGAVDVAFIPGHGVLDFLWLAANGALCLVLGHLTLKRS